MAIAGRHFLFFGALIVFVGLPALMPRPAQASNVGPATAAVGSPEVVTAPTISGSAAIGQTLTASTGTWTNDPTSFAYQWLECSGSSGCDPISDATNSTYTVPSSLAGYTLEVQVVASNSTGPSAAATSAPTAAVPIPTEITLTASPNPARTGTRIVFTVTLSRRVDGGAVSFYAAGEQISGCASISLNSLDVGATCTIASKFAGQWSISAQYSGDSSYTPSSASLIETVTGSTRKAPPSTEVGGHGPKVKPSFRLTLTALRTNAFPHRYWFAVKQVRCLNRASAVLVTIRKTTTRARCGAKFELASKPVATHHYYLLSLRAVRYGKRHAVVAHGQVYEERLYMPGDEAKWKPTTP